MTTKSQLMRLPPSEGDFIQKPSPINPTSLYIGAPVSYHVSHHTQICKSCGSYHAHNHVSLRILGGRGTIFRAVGRFEYNLPIIVHHNAPEYIPACLTCAQHINLSHLPPPPAMKESPAAVRAKWRVEGGKLVPREKGKKPTPTIQDLF